MKRSQQVRIFSRPGDKDIVIHKNYDVYVVHITLHDNAPYGQLIHIPDCLCFNSNVEYVQISYPRHSTLGKILLLPSCL